MIFKGLMTLHYLTVVPIAKLGGKSGLADSGDQALRSFEC